MDVLEGTSAVQNLWNALPAAVQKRLQDTEPQQRRAFGADSEDESYAQTLDGSDVRGETGLVYDEHAFEYVLEIERRRAESLQQPFLLMLIECNELHGTSRLPIRPERLFRVLRKSLRETDVLGWYLQGAVVGAAIMPDCATAAKQVSTVVRERTVKAFNNHLPPAVVSRLRLHVYEVLGDDELRVE